MPPRAASSCLTRTLKKREWEIKPGSSSRYSTRDEWSKPIDDMSCLFDDWGLCLRIVHLYEHASESNDVWQGGPMDEMRNGTATPLCFSGTTAMADGSMQRESLLTGDWLQWIIR